MANPQKVLFTSIFWDEEEQLLYIADELGYIYIALVYLGEKYTIQKKVCEIDLEQKGLPPISLKIKKIDIYDDGPFRTLFCFTDRGMYPYRIKMG